MRTFIACAGVCALLATQVMAEVGLRPEAKLTPAASAETNLSKALTNSSVGLPTGLAAPQFIGLLDPERFSIQHSVGMSFTSGSFGGMNQYYLSTITYKAAKPLTIRAQVGVANTMFGTPIGGLGASATQIIIPDVSLLYQPKDNLRIEFRFQQGGNRMPGDRWGDIWY